MTDTDLPTNVMPLRPKDPTAALRARRARRKRKSVTRTVTLPVTAVSIAPSENLNEIKPSVTVVGNASNHDGISGVDIGRSIAIRDAARSAASITAPENSYLARILTLEPVSPVSPPGSDRDRHHQLGSWQGSDTRSAPPEPPPATSGVVVFYAAALALATVSAGYSITGMTAIFTGAFWPVIAMGIALEIGKLCAVTALPTLRWRPLKGALIALVAVLMALNSIGAYGFLAKAHIASAVAGETAVAGRAADIEARLSVQAGVLADLDRRLAQIDGAVEKATAKGRTNSAMALADQQRKTRTELVAQRTTEAKMLAGLQVEKATIDGERAMVEADLGPVRYLATLLGAGDQDALRYFILVVALLLDPAAVLLLQAATSARR